MPAIYRLSGIQQTYAGRTVLDLDNFEVLTGEILVVVGPSGAGKSTLLRLLNFLEAPSQGSLSYKGLPAGPDLALGLRRQVTTVFQSPALLSGNVEKNVAYGLSLRGAHHPNQLVDEMLQLLGLEGLRRASVRTLSGGEAQRVALARALVLQPEVLLLDEPTANLDPYNVSLIESVVREINRLRGTTVILVTHNVFQARRLASRVALLLNGRMVEVGPAPAFFADPQDARTRAFVNGEMVY